jgi:hypothetical protein
LEEEIAIKNLLSERTVERCMEDDPRIMSKGKKHFLSEKARLESRYLNPEYFGSQIFRATMRFRASKPLEKRVREFVTRYGAFIFFNFLEAVRPFNDNSISIKEREELVELWVQNSIPISDMVLHFQASFEDRKAGHDWKSPFSEMKEEKIEKILTAFRRAFPDVYEDLIRGRKETFGKTVKETRPGVTIDTYHDKLYGLDKTSVNSHKRS